ncbi:hypothetical protein EAG_06515 [Camponotus floridanus]|uniref:Uncharacterized protein n=1 Tax=Camponotus floridanus TaxID=104421 RepID=E2AQ23_CAMFO|nr:hypothetical protein EAG_06515 [Camponotus floridanus]
MAESENGVESVQPKLEYYMLTTQQFSQLIALNAPIDMIVMVATGTTVLMAASEENLSSKTENTTTRLVNQNICLQGGELQHYDQKNIESLIKEDVTTCSSNIIKKKQCSLTAEKNNKIISKIESKENKNKNCAICKTTQIRETKTSRLRAASIMLSNEMDVTLSKKRGSEAPGSQRCNSSTKQIFVMKYFLKIPKIV